MDSNLVANEQYYAIITAVNANGESLYNVTVKFGMYNNNCCTMITVITCGFQVCMTSSQ